MRSTLVAAFLAAATLTSASVHQPSTSAHQQVARSLPASVHKHDPRTLCLLDGLLGGLLGGGNGCGGTYPSSSWQCSGSGLDGYDYDHNKKKCPSSYPSGWKWFGTQHGWGPAKGWQQPSNSWSPPSDFLSSCHKFSWWAPSSSWVYPQTSVSLLPIDLWLGLGWHSYKGPSQSWSCDKSGNDGWEFDFQGNSCPYSGVSGWRYFGKGFGWQPPRSWSPPSNSWSIPSGWDFGIATWWSPPSSWQCPSNVSPPSWWPSKPTTTTTMKPSTTTQASSSTAAPSPSAGIPPRDFQCDHSGNDGWSLDFDGNSLPYEADHLLDSNGAWKFFGWSCGGWLPEESWNVPSDTWCPPEGLTVWDLAQATWWSPASSWQYPESWGVNPIPFWHDLNPSWKSWLDNGSPSSTSTSAAPSSTPSKDCPAKGWQTDGSGNDGWSVDADCNTCPYSADNLYDSNGSWKWFGSVAGWQPSEPWNVPYADWTPPAGYTDAQVKLATWWVPGSYWKFPASWKVPSFWFELDPSYTPWTATKTSTSAAPSATSSHDWPTEGWTCDNSGNDGKDHDHLGNTCPYGNLPFKWFGKSHGWLPVKGWWSVSADFSFPAEFLSSCNKATWWAPSSQWRYPVGFAWPSFWPSLGWSGYNWAPSSFVCSGKGDDGFSFDHLGHGRPSGFPEGFLYFGIGPQWQPHAGFQLPSSQWSPPSGWSPRYATWWKPTGKWTVPNGYSCPQWWPQSLLSGIFSWIF